MPEDPNIPVLLFTGFLDSGKTTFIQSILEDKDFNDGKRILVLLCEEGEVELDPSKFSGKNVSIEILDDQSKISQAYLDKLNQKYDPQQVLVEYNGMWLLDPLFEQIPMDWIVAGETTFADANTYLQYNSNMRQLVYDKLKTAEMVIFNHVTADMDKMPLHKLVRGVSRRSNIAYSRDDGKTEYDAIEDPLPFDVNADVIVIEDRDYALFYSDLLENFEKYHGKKAQLKVMALVNSNMPKRTFVAGRQLMQCCVEDIQFAALAYLYDNVSEIVNEGWYMVEVEIGARFTSIYGKKGPVFKVLSIRPTSEPEEVVATFY